MSKSLAHLIAIGRECSFSLSHTVEFLAQQKAKFSLSFTFLASDSNDCRREERWRPQHTLPCFGLQYSISKKTRTTVSLSSMQGVFAESSLRKQAWRNPKEGRVGCLHQNIFTRKVTDIAFTSDFCNNYSRPASPASLYLTSPRPILDVLKSLVSRPQVPSPHTRVPIVPVPLLYTAVKIRFHGWLVKRTT